MAVDIKTLKIRLIEAEDAYHQLLTGTKEVSVNVGNFGSVTYNQTSLTALETYISSLKSQIATAEGLDVGRRKIIKICF
ncbi:MAG: gpW family protein [Acetobacter sp.]|nr:gpW family protein [Acetobacter sp.]